MRLLIDMNLAPRWVPYLSAAGHEAVHWSSAGPATARDEAICQYAHLHNYILVTNDLDFPLILAHTRHVGPSVVLLRGEPLVPEARGEAFLRALQECRTELESGAVVTLDWSDRARARVLPLR